MDVFHMLEFLDLPYEIDLPSLSARYGKPINGSHIILFGASHPLLKRDRLPDAGLYECDPDSGRIYFVDGASDYREIRNERQFIIIDGPPALPERLAPVLCSSLLRRMEWRAGPPATDENGLVLGDPLQRLCRILFPNPVMNERETLTPWVLDAVDWVYEQMFG
jgi:hypothetical protein